MSPSTLPLRTTFRLRYLIGLVLVAVLVGVSLLVDFKQAAGQQGGAALVSLATGQKSLSQRIAFSANALLNARSAAERAAMRHELLTAIDSMRSAHRTLTHGGGASKGLPLHAVHDVYFNDYAPFDEEVQTFLDAAERLATVGDDELAAAAILLDEVNLLGMQTIMQAHDVIALIVTEKTEEMIAQAQRIEIALATCILLLLIAESLLIFEPMGRLIDRSLSAVGEAKRIAEAEATRARQADEAKSNFLRVVSHELRTPLNAIIGMTELLAGTRLDSEQSGYLGHLRSGGEHMLALANDVLTVNQFAAGQLDCAMHATNVANEIERVIGMLGPRAAERRISLTAEVERGVSGLVESDAHKLRQVLINLVGNAIKFTDAGEVRVHAAAQHDEDGTVRLFIRVHDTGRGIPDEKRDAIFEEFEQGAAFGERRSAGAGLGLPISRKIAEGLGGTLVLERSDAGGSVFLLTLETVRVPEPQEEKALVPAAPGPSAPERGGTVLVADDILPNRLIARAHLERLGYRVVEAENGHEAVESARVIPDLVLILMDIEMPVMDGEEATAAIRREPEPLASVPIAALTAHVLAEDTERMLAEGFDDVIRKPVSVDAIRSVLDRPRAVRRAA